MELSHIALVSKGYASIKTTIPQNIAKALKLKANDVLEWHLEDSNNKACFWKLKSLENLRKGKGKS